MSVNMELYRVFLTVADSSSLSSAARELHISQPAVSQSIRQLETQLDCCLFTRTPKGVELTDGGHVLLGYIRQAMGLINAGEEHISNIQNLVCGELKIGASDTLCSYFLMPYLKRFNAAHPDIQLSVTNRTTNETITLLKSGKVDIAFANLPVDDPQVCVKECMDVHDVFVAGEKFSILKGSPVTWQSLARLPLILLEPASNSRQYLNRCAAQFGVTLSPAFELGAHALLLEFAKIGLGVACVTKEFTGGNLENEGLFELQLAHPVPARSVGLLTLSGVPASYAAEQFARLF